MVLHMLQQEPIKKTYLQAAQAALGCGHGESCHEPTAENNHAVAFFRTPGVVETLECAGDRISVGCRNGQVLHLQTPWLVDSKFLSVSTIEAKCVLGHAL